MTRSKGMPSAREVRAEDDDRLQPLPNGRVLIRFAVITDGNESEIRTITLRRPRHGEYREFHESLAESADAEQAGAKALQERVAAEDRTISTAERIRFANHGEEVLIQWAHKVMEVLGDADVPSPKDLPEWLGNNVVSSSMLNHWRTVPLVPLSE